MLVAGSYISALANMFKPATPPATNTLPLGSRTATWLLRAAAIDPAGLQVAVRSLWTLARGISWPGMEASPQPVAIAVSRDTRNKFLMVFPVAYLPAI